MVDLSSSLCKHKRLPEGTLTSVFIGDLFLAILSCFWRIMLYDTTVYDNMGMGQNHGT